MTYIDIVFDGPPSHESGRFVEVEDAAGKSISIGKWLQREDGYWALRLSDPRGEADPPLSRAAIERETVEALRNAGWSVAVHNDYRVNGEPHTFWLFTHPDGRWIKGEGCTDAEALEQCRHALDPSQGE